MLAIGIVLAMLHSLTADLAPPGAIVGRVDVRLPLKRSHCGPSAQDTGPRVVSGEPDRHQSVVYLENAPRSGLEEAAREQAVLYQQGETFVPYVLPVMVGTTVEFLNRDPFYHNVFSLSKAARFDLGRYPEGRSRSVRLDRPGMVRVFCEIHSHMSAFILVISHRYFASTTADGRYRIEAVPPGEYELVVWTDGEERSKTRVRVVPGRTVELDFVVEP